MKVSPSLPTSIYSPDYTPGVFITQVLQILQLFIDDVSYSGECATHFRQILQQYPPQVSSRSTAAAWGCHVHNEVNKSLNKEIFDCSKIGDFYDCGCAEDSGTQVAAKTGMSGVHSVKEPAKDEMEAVSLSHEE